MTEKIDKKKLEKRAKGLYTLLSILFAIFSIGVSIYMAYQDVFNGIDVTVFPGAFHFVLCAIMGFVFVPLLALVRKWAQESGAEKLYARATKWFRIFAICIAGTLIFNVLAYFIPGLFS